MSDDGTLPDRLRNMVRNPNAIGTHCEACWQWHDDCALLLAAALLCDLAAENDRLRALTEDDPYSIYHEAAEMRSELMHLRRWKLEATEVIESWERVYEALGDVGGLGQPRSDAVLAEVLRMKAERDELRAELDRILDAIGDPDSLMLWVHEHNSIKLRQTAERIADAVNGPT